MIERHIDYLAFSAFLSELSLSEQDFQSVPAPRFYKRGYVDAHGWRYYFGNPNSKKALIVGSAAALHNARISGKTDEEILSWALDGGGVVSRLDLAVTEWIESELVTVDEVKAWYTRGLVESSFTSGGGKAIISTTQDGKDSIETFYIGDITKRGKKGIFRAYDKGVELEIGAYLATRLEVELKGDNAISTANRIAKTGDIAGNFRAKLNVKHNDFDRLMDAPITDVARGKAKEKESEDEAMNKRWAWLTEKVAPVLKEAREYDNRKGKKDNRMYWFLRSAGFSDGQAKAVLAIKTESE